MRWIALSVALFALYPATVAAVDYVVLVQDQPAGHLKLQTAADGWVETDYSYRNNGRGPDLRERIRVDANGLPVAYEVSGRSTMGAEVRESFRREGNRAVWTSRADQGDETVPEDFVFLPQAEDAEDGPVPGGGAQNKLQRRGTWRVHDGPGHQTQGPGNG